MSIRIASSRFGTSVSKGAQLKAVCARLVAVGLIGSVVGLTSGGSTWAGSSERGAVVTFAGVLPQNGCPHCCKFACRLTPSPTPEFDDQGRRVFTQSRGRFLLVVEGDKGEALFNPSVAGTRKRTGEIESLGAFSRPGLQVEFENDLGDGSSFVDCHATHQGGVPAAEGLSEAQLTDAMVDAACRFEWVPQSDACTRNAFGDFETIDDSTVRQYCFQVSEASAFPSGLTVVTVRLRDEGGNLGPLEQFVVRVGAPEATPTPTPTPTGGVHLSGRVQHFGTGFGVGGVEVEASSGTATTTAVDGSYELGGIFPDASAPVDVSAAKLGGAQQGISPLDAAYILQGLAGNRQLSQIQELACDVTGDGTLSAMDASQILKHQVGLVDRFAVTEPDRCGSDWGFFPLPAAAPNQTVVLPTIDAGDCTAGTIRYDPLVEDAVDQDFIAYAYGDCTGNWQPQGGAVLSAASTSQVRLGRVRTSRSGRVKIPVYVDSTRPIQAVSFDVSYDARVLAPQRLRRARRAADALWIENSSEPGTIRVALAASRPLDIGARPVALLRFRPRGRARIGAIRIGITASTVEAN